MNWFEKRVNKRHEKGRKSFQNEQSKKHETDYKWIGGKDSSPDWDVEENVAFMKMSIFLICVTVFLIIYYSV